jgi:hypothetical protein
VGPFLRIVHLFIHWHRVPALRRPFIPPTSATPLIVRSVDYAGEVHPATIKRTVVVPVAQLPLRDVDAMHKFKILAGVRWTPDPPKDAGVGPNETGREHGYIKVSCEDFPEPAQNLKWASDVIDRLIAEANVSSVDLFVCYLSDKPMSSAGSGGHVQRHSARHQTSGGKSAKIEARGSSEWSYFLSTIYQGLPEGMATRTRRMSYSTRVGRD